MQMKNIEDDIKANNGIQLNYRLKMCLLKLIQTIVRNTALNKHHIRLYQSSAIRQITGNIQKQCELEV